MMKKEELISFLSLNSNYLSLNGFTPKLQDVMYKICDIAIAYIYPEENFKPRVEADSEAAA